MKYNPKDATLCLPAGTYDATIKAIVDEKDDGSPLTSRAGEQMEKIVYTVYSDQGERTLSDYILGRPNIVAWKYSVLAKALGQKATFDEGAFDPRNFVGENIRIELSVEDYQGQDQNKIVTVHPKAAGQAERKPSAGTTKWTKPGAEMSPDEIPF